MRRERHTPEEIIGKIREAEVLLSQDRSVGQLAIAAGIREQTHYRPAQAA